jgi:hypothetical protein
VTARVLAIYLHIIPVLKSLIIELVMYGIIQKKSGLDYHEVLLPKNGDKKYLDPAVLWNHFEDIEKEKMLNYRNISI